MDELETLERSYLEKRQALEWLAHSEDAPGEETEKSVQMIMLTKELSSVSYRMGGLYKDRAESIMSHFHSLLGDPLIQ